MQSRGPSAAVACCILTTGWLPSLHAARSSHANRTNCVRGTGKNEPGKLPRAGLKLRLACANAALGGTCVVHKTKGGKTPGFKSVFGTAEGLSLPGPSLPPSDAESPPSLHLSAGPVPRQCSFSCGAEDDPLSERTVTARHPPTPLSRGGGANAGRPWGALISFFLYRFICGRLGRGAGPRQPSQS